MGWFRDVGRDRPWLQGCIIAAAGLILSIGTCFGFLFTMNFNTGVSKFGETATGCMAAILFLCVLAVPVGVVWFIVGLVKNANRKNEGPTPESPSPTPPTNTTPPPPPPPPSNTPLG